MIHSKVGSGTNSRATMPSTIYLPADPLTTPSIY